MTPLSARPPTEVIELLEDPRAIAPDRDWQSLRDEAMGELRDSAWTDHNVSDPGVTLLEAGLLSVAEAHARTAMARFDLSPVASAMWRDHPGASDIDLPITTSSTAALAAGLADHLVTAQALVAEVPDRPEAVAALASNADLGWSPDLALAAVHILRRTVFNRAALDLSGAVDAAIDAVGPEQASALLRLDPGFDQLWDAELLDLLELRRRRRLVERIRQVQTALRETITRADVDALLLPTDDPADEPADEIVNDASRGAAFALARCPEVGPETFEAEDGATLVWPPTAIQTRTVEPVIEADYVRLALGVDGVRRAWVRRGHTDGLGWNCEPITEPVDHPGTLTILVEADTDAAPGSLVLEQQVLEALADPTDDLSAGELAEVTHPYALYRDDLTRATPRRMIGDELAVTRLSICQIEVRSAIHIAVGTVDDRDAVIAEALARVGELFRNGRPESQRPTAADVNCPQDIDGPWPIPAHAAPGWIPGEAIRFNEVVERLADSPDILGVTDVALRHDGDWYQPGPDEIAELALSPTCVPELAPGHCLRVHFVLPEES